ncbi:MAG: hypothetical protein C4527_12055 [Candidatus Omnitrophota bacterium]|nr:MAG: hypothetical protein C4527_12055 [Candidatus Omnitrophota bacterium]
MKTCLLHRSIDVLMNKKNTDNRMAWIRNLEKLSEYENDSYFLEYEIATETHIPGIFNYNNGKIVCAGFSYEKDINGLQHYLIRIKIPKHEEPYYNQVANKKGYYFSGGIIGELMSLFSVFFQCRFYLIASYWGELTNQTIKIKKENNFTYINCSKEIHPKIFDDRNRNFAIGLTDFLDSIKKLNVDKHQSYALACYHYARSLKEVGIDSEMLFIRLVSSIETLSESFPLNKKDNPLEGEIFSQLFNECDLSDAQRKQLKQILNVSRERIKIYKSKQRFVKFIEKYSKGYLRGGNWKAKQLKIARKDIPKELSKIYDARSSYLHKGEPMYLSQFMRNPRNWDKDPSLGMIVDNKRFSAKEKLPYSYWFEDIVRFCLLKYLDDK